MRASPAFSGELRPGGRLWLEEPSVQVQAQRSDDFGAEDRNLRADHRAGVCETAKLSDVPTRLADHIRQLRLETGLTQAELAARAGVTVETVARLERVLRGRSSANSNPSLETLVRLAGALGVEVAELLSEPSRPRPKEDRISMILRTANPATRRRVLRVAEALVREDHAEERPVARKQKR
jgi:transcriptional regulator with XRE-family HTH domain